MSSPTSKPLNPQPKVTVDKVESFMAGTHEGCSQNDIDHTHMSGIRIEFDPALVILFRSGYYTDGS